MASGNSSFNASPIVLQKRIQLPKSNTTAIIVSLNRPSNLNAFNTQVCIALSQIFSDIAHEANHDDTSSPLSAVIFTGEGKSFCAGADLSNPPNPIEQSSDLPHHLTNNPVYQMGKINIPIIGAIQGHCITGGFELALACDFLIGDETTKFKDTHVKFGFAPCWGLSQKLQRRIGPSKAKLISFTAGTISARKALEWGLLDEIASDALSRAIEIADEIGGNDGVMVKRYKRAIEEGGGMDLYKGLQRERELGLAHYLEVVQDGKRMESAKGFIQDENRPRSRL